MNYSTERSVAVSDDIDKHDISPSGLFIIGRTNDTYFTQCGNHVKNSEVEHITANINHINSLNKDELKAYYRERRKAKNDNPERRGAGLGLIEIARRSSSALEFEFTEVDEERSFFSLYSTVSIR